MGEEEGYDGVRLGYEVRVEGAVGVDCLRGGEGGREGEDVVF